MTFQSSGRSKPRRPKWFSPNPALCQSLTSQRGHCRKACGPLEVISGYSHSVCSDKLDRRRGPDRKAFGPLEVISGYSHRRCSAKLSFHNLSLHTQAHEEYYEHQRTAFAGRPVAMRESRALTPVKDSGNKHAPNPPHLSQTCSSMKESCKPLRDSTQNERNITNHRKCRSENARITRRANRACKKRFQRQLFRRIRSQAIGLARQLPAFIAQDPTNATHLLPARRNSECETETLPPMSEVSALVGSESSEYQDTVLLGRYPIDLRVASLNCRGLSSISKRERVIHLMTKHNIDILCLQETKINSNSKEIHDDFVMIWSSGVSDDNRNKAEELKRSGRASRTPEHNRTFRAAIEHLGVGIVYRKKLQKYVKDIKQVSARNIMMTLHMHAGCLDIVSTYVPQACHVDHTAADRHYVELESLMDEHYAFSPRLVLGDFNARLIKALPHESTAIGPHTLGASWADLDSLSPAQVNNRSRLVDFCLSRNMVVSNTFFQKPQEQLVTYRAVGVKKWEPPWQLHKYAQMDFILVNHKWRNAIKNISSTYIHAVDTDHKLLLAEVQFKLKAKPFCPAPPAVRYRTPTKQQLVDFNDDIRAMLAQPPSSSKMNCPSLDSLNCAMKASADATLLHIPPAQKKPYISQSTWQLLEAKWDAIELGDDDLADTLSKQIKDCVRKDREDHLLAQLEEVTAQGYKWEGLKRLRSKFTPAFTKFKDSDGKHVAVQDYPHKCADYLQRTQWKKPVNTSEQVPRLNSPLQNGSYVIYDSPFTAAELKVVLSRIKRNKSPGDDGIQGELYKWLDDQNRTLLLEAANKCLEQGCLQEKFMRAIVVSIYTKGDSSLLANYRPISLLCSCYKIVAALVKERLDAGLDGWLMQTQYGFRKGKSTSQAIFVARRLQDIAEKTKRSSTLILLDWEKAFDKVSQDKLTETLQRLRVPSRILNLICSFYDNPLFKVKVGTAESTWRPQEAGIRQGCPLSPYLFVLLMGALFSDIKTELCTKRQQEPIDGIGFAEVLYADDTLIFGANTHCINVLLHAIERHSDYYGLKLNYDKCVNLTANQRISSVRFSPTGPAQGRLVPRKHAAVYLGSLLTDSFDNKAEVLNRLGDCIATANRLKLFWQKAKTSITWKIQVFHAIVRSKLLYGLECIQLTQSEISRLNGFQNKSLRRILGKPPTFIDRQATNQRMYDEIRDVHGCNFEHFGDTWKKAKMRLFGHVLRASSADPMNQVCLDVDNLRPRQVHGRRSGRPRMDWVVESYKDAFEAIHGAGADFDVHNTEHLRQVKAQALSRSPPFT